MGPENMLFVVLMGIGTVFFGLICIIFLTMIMGKVMANLNKNAPASVTKPAAAVKEVSAVAAKPIGLAPEIIAVITAVLSEDPSITSHGAHITSIKQL